MSPAIPPIIEVDELHALRASGRPLRLLDVRWALDGSAGEHTYRGGHLPGAVYVDLETELAGRGSAAQGRHPLPEPEDFARAMRRVGVGDDDVVVAYDDTGGAYAARLVWMLRVLGTEAALLDGGLDAWDGELETDDVRPAEGSFTARPFPASVLATIDEVASGRSVVVDARAPERYRGEVEPVDPRAGHVPGAVNVPFAGNLGPGGRFLPADRLRERFTGAGVPAQGGVVVYCGSGITATHDLLALERAGIPGARLFPGSWSQWSAEGSRPVTTGEDP